MPDFMPQLVVALLFFGAITAVIADSKGHRFEAYFVVGALLGPLGVLVALLSPTTPEKEAQRQHAIEAAKRRLAD
jgi:hypothetical protein